MTVDVLLDALRAFVAIGQATDGGRLTDAFDGIAALHADHDQRLLVQGVHGQCVRAYGGQVDDNGRHTFDQDLAHFRVLCCVS